jgi:hypothetical protein
MTHVIKHHSLPTPVLSKFNCKLLDLTNTCMSPSLSPSLHSSTRTKNKKRGVEEKERREEEEEQTMELKQFKQHHVT